jgi:hypothetical protein
LSLSVLICTFCCNFGTKNKWLPTHSTGRYWKLRQQNILKDKLVKSTSSELYIIFFQERIFW